MFKTSVEIVTFFCTFCPTRFGYQDDHWHQTTCQTIDSSQDFATLWLFTGSATSTWTGSSRVRKIHEFSVKITCWSKSHIFGFIWVFILISWTTFCALSKDVSNFRIRVTQFEQGLVPNPPNELSTHSVQARPFLTQCHPRLTKRFRRNFSCAFQWYIVCYDQTMINFGYLGDNIFSKSDVVSFWPITLWNTSPIKFW